MNRYKKETYWKDAETWVCPNHFPVNKLPRQISRCWFSSCNAQRPPAKIETPKLTLILPTGCIDDCYWHGCDKGPNGEPAKRREKSKYCSTDCKNRNARWRYKNKKKKVS